MQDNKSQRVITNSRYRDSAPRDRFQPKTIEAYSYHYIISKDNGRISVHDIILFVCSLYSSTSTRIEKLKFSYFNKYERSRVGSIFLDKPYVNFVFPIFYNRVLLTH